MDNTFYMIDTNGRLKRSVNGIAEMVVKTVEDNGVIYNVSDNEERTVIQNILKDGDITYLTNNRIISGILRLDITSHEHRKVFQNIYGNRAERASSFEDLKDLYLTVLDVMNYEYGIYINDNGTINFNNCNGDHKSSWLRSQNDNSALYRIITEFTQRIRNMNNATNLNRDGHEIRLPWDYMEDSHTQPQYDIRTSEGMVRLENYFRPKVNWLKANEAQCTFAVVNALYNELHALGVESGVTIEYKFDEYNNECCTIWSLKDNGFYNHDDLKEHNKPSLLWIFATYDKLQGEELIKQQVAKYNPDPIKISTFSEFETEAEDKQVDTQQIKSSFTASETAWLFKGLRAKKFIINTQNTTLSNKISELTNISPNSIRQELSSLNLSEKSKEQLKILLNSLIEDLNN